MSSDYYGGQAGEIADQGAAATFDPAANLDMADWARTAVALGDVRGDQLPDESVSIAEIYQSHCDLPRCSWVSGCLSDLGMVSDQAQHHLNRHRAALTWARGGGR